MKLENVLKIGLIIFLSFGLGYGTHTLIEGFYHNHKSALGYFEVSSLEVFDNGLITLKFHNLPMNYEYTLIYPNHEDTHSNYYEWEENNTFSMNILAIHISKQESNQDTYILRLFKQNVWWDWLEIKIYNLRGI